MNKTPYQPEKIAHRGSIYTRVRAWEVIDEKHGITVGPFYSREGVNVEDWAFTPDSGFLWIPQASLSVMHCIQQRANPTTPSPGSGF